MQKPSRFKIWLCAIRLKTLPAAFCPVMVGGSLAYAQGCFYWPTWCLTALTAMLLQAIANLANDYFDYRHGFDQPGRQGPLRIMQNGLAKPRTFIMVIGAMSAAAVLMGAVLVWYGGWPILVVGVISLAFAFLYSAGPYPLSTHALGEAASLVFFGLVAGGGAYYLQAGHISLLALALSCIPGLLNACIMLVNNYRDIELDRAYGKTTLATLLGPGKARMVYVGFVITAYLIGLAAVLTRSIPPAGLLVLLTLPLAVKLIRDMYTKLGQPLNTTLAKTALLNLLACLLLSAGLLF